MASENKIKVFYVVFGLIALGDIIGRIFESQWLDFMFKPLIMPSLMLYVFAFTKMRVNRFVKTILFGQFFSFIGDCALMFGGEGLPFLLGLGSFLTAHIAYVYAFVYEINHFGDSSKMIILRKKWLLLPFMLVLGVFLYILFPHLGEMTAPVCVYAFTIMCMSVTALNRSGYVSNETFTPIFIGSLLFMLSDMILAYSLFVKTFPYAGVLVMLTYISAQFLIAHGTIKK